MFKKIITSIVLACFIFVNAGSYFATTTLAQEDETWYFQNYDTWHARVYDSDNPDEIFGERYTAAQVEWVIYGIFAFVLNHMIGNEGLISCIIEYRDNPVVFVLNCGDDVIAQIQDWVGSGFLGSTDSTNPSSTNLAINKNPIEDILSGERPVSGIGYVRNAVGKFSLVKEAQAQGFGFGAAESIRALWVAVRNVTYFFLVLMIIGMAFLVMFRFKINPQTVITVQSALPKIIMALLLITFSYAIAGFMIDLLYVVIGIVAAVLSQSGLFAVGETNSWIYMYEALTGTNFGQGIVGTLLLYLLLFILIAFFALFSNIAGMALWPATLIVWVILIVIAVIAILFILVKVVWMLIKTFVTTILLIVVSPISIVTGGFTGWLKNFASNLAVFAAIGPMLAIAYLFLGNALPDSWVGATTLLGIDLTGFISENLPFHPDITALGSSSWSPPFLPFGGDMDIIWLVASFVVITLIPNVANMIKSAVQGKPFGYGTAIGAAIGGAAGVAWSPFGTQISGIKDAYTKTRSTELLDKMRRSRVGQSLGRVLGF